MVPGPLACVGLGFILSDRVTRGFGVQGTRHRPKWTGSAPADESGSTRNDKCHLPRPEVMCLETKSHLPPTPPICVIFNQADVSSAVRLILHQRSQIPHGPDMSPPVRVSRLPKGNPHQRFSRGPVKTQPIVATNCGDEPLWRLPEPQAPSQNLFGGSPSEPNPWKVPTHPQFGK